MLHHIKKLKQKNYLPYYFTVLAAVSIFAIFGKDIAVRSDVFRIAAGDNGSRPQYVLGTATIESIGVEILNQGDDNLNATFTLEYKKSSDSSWKPAYTPIRSYNKTSLGVNNTYYYGSLMFLDPSTAYDFRATVTDPDGGTGTVKSGSATTKSGQVGGSTLRTLYVDVNTGNDSNNGTSPSTAFKTIQHAANISLAGDKIIVQPGTYRENVTISRSGTASNPIIYESANLAINPGSNPAYLEGGEEALATPHEKDLWLPDDHQPANTGVYYTVLSSWITNPNPQMQENPIYVAQGSEKIYAYWYYPYNASTQTFNNFINGQYCSVNCSSSCCPTGISGGYWYDGTSRKLYVRLPSGADPDDSVMHVVKRNSMGFNLNGVKNVVIRGFEISYYHTGIKLTGQGAGTSDNYIEKNYVRYNGSGIGVGYYGANGTSVYTNTIQDNIIHDTKVSEWPWETVKLNDVESDGITMGAYRGNIVRNNTIHDVFNGIMMGIFWGETDENYNKETDISGNQLYDIGDDAIEPEGANVNLRIFNNKIYKVSRSIAAQAGISLAPSTKGPIWIVRNVISSVKQTAFKVSVQDSNPIGQTLIFHNTVYNNLGDFMALFRIWTPITGVKAILRNNLFLAAGTEGSGAGYGYLFEDMTSSHSNPAISLDMDYDSFYSNRQSDCGLNCRFVVWLNNTYNTLAAFSAASGQESHGVGGDPKLVSASSGNFTPDNFSPLINKAVLLPGINDSYISTGPDIGAIESSASACIENWVCGNWSACTNSNQTRTCNDTNNCGTTTNQPTLSQSCVSCVPNWNCSSWSTCTNNTQTRTCPDINNCNDNTTQPALSQSCVSNPSCTPNWTCSAWSACANNTQTRSCSDVNNCNTSSGQPSLSQGCNTTLIPSTPPIVPPPTTTPTSTPPSVKDHTDTGKLLALVNQKNAAVYLIANNGKKYVFPDSTTYATWYSNFNKVQRVNSAKLDAYPDGGVVPFKPGSFLVTHQDTAKVYTVEANGVIRHIPTETVAKSIYGSYWNNLVRDVIPGFFASSYTIGDPLANKLPNNSLVKLGSDYYYIIGQFKRKFKTISVVWLNNFNPARAITITSLDSYLTGHDIISKELGLSDYRPNVSEAYLLGKDPKDFGDSADVDGDGLSNYEEKYVWLTNYRQTDTDNDRFNDLLELKNGYNPNGPGTIEQWLNR